MSADELAVELVTAGLPVSVPDALEDFIGCGESSHGDLARRHREIKAELAERLEASQL